MFLGISFIIKIHQKMTLIQEQNITIIKLKIFYMKNNVKDLLKQSGALLEGHFLLTSGKHSNKYVEKFRLMESPEHLNKICRLMSEKYNNHDIDIVMGAAIGGILLSGGVGKHLNKKSIFTERIKGKMELRRGFEIKEDDNILIVEDIVTTGGSIFELIKIIEKCKGNVAGILCIVNRNIEEINFGYNFQSLLNYPIRNYDRNDCPDCLNKIPMIHRGRSGK